jgi:hypothetical protein
VIRINFLDFETHYNFVVFSCVLCFCYASSLLMFLLVLGFLCFASE